ncbi:MAG: isoprenyl transferase [Thermacetogeniaceae bacterium]|jgi:undecaprenyl diphosphate synthase|nr:isoprenyl transferase [Thermoanaerobacterales bacterium]NLN20657.1 isoprenyl transferase [Syntrophomonadaceae bacterium]
MNRSVYYQKLDKSRLPYHVAVIMDGNGRWAQERNLPRAVGHRTGMESLRTVVKLCSQLGIKILTVYAFSTENWKRPQEEVSVLMGLLYEYIKKELDELNREEVQIRVIGRLNELPARAQQEIKRAEELTAKNNKLIFNIALNYGGRAEIVDAARRVASLAVEGKIEPEEITEELVQLYLYTGEMPDPDLLIRPAGEKRISNFLLWQIAYTEFYFTDVYWPDFGEEDFLKALDAYQNRKRRFGGL